MLNIPECKNAERVFYYFEKLCEIPHGSGNCSHIADYLVGFAKEHSLEYYRDSADNVLIRKPSTKGLEDRPTVIIQGHTDMVAEKTADSDKDLTTCGIEVYRDGDFLRAKDTTLGGDDGVAVAYGLALLESDSIPHPALEVLFTSDEEIGLIGAEAFDKSLLRGKILINIDSDEEGIFVAGCAGGVRTDIALPIKREAFVGKKYKLTVTGLQGGHSGMEINRGRANAIKVGFDVLSRLDNIRLVSAIGGNMDNAIPREIEAFFVSESDATESFDSTAKTIIDTIKGIEPDVQILLSESEFDTLPCDKESTDKILQIVSSVPYGPQEMNADNPELVEVSLNSGILRLEDEFKLCTSVRSSSEAKKEGIVNLLRGIAESVGADFSTRGAYPGWEYKSDSKIRRVCVEAYKKLYGKDAQVITIHAGLECGLFTGAIEGLDCISMGPDNFDIHTTEEHLSIFSSARVWDFLLEVLKAI